MVALTVGDLSRWGITRPTDIGPVSQVTLQGRVPLIDVGTIDLIKQGALPVFPGIERFTESGVSFVDGRHEELDAVVLATGYRARLAEVLAEADRLIDDRGYPRWHGEEAPIPGLYFIGFRNPISGALHDIHGEAKRIASSIAGERARG